MPRPSASSPASGSSASRTTCCSANAGPRRHPARPAPGNGRKAADIYAQLLAAEPHATAERKRELRTEAVKKARQSPLFFDLTISLSKSISIFHASLGENARLARQAGDQDGEKYWSGLVGEVDDMIWQAVHAGFGYFQREAGYTRTGSHNTRVHGRETGQWHEADLAVAHWLQHTSRDGDMQLHVHSQIAHIARTTTDGKWRAPDSLGYNEHIGAVAAIVSQHLEEALTARFGLEWVARDDGHGFEMLPGQHPRHRLGHRDARLLPHPQRRSHHPGHLRRIARRGQLSQPRPVSEPARHRPRHLPGQPGLAHPAGPGHRHQPVLRQQVRDLARRACQADKAGQYGREAMHATGGGFRRGHPHARTITAGRSNRTERLWNRPVPDNAGHPCSVDQGAFDCSPRADTYSPLALTIWPGRRVVPV